MWVKVLPHFGWDYTINQFTQNCTQELMKEFIDQIREKILSFNCKRLMEIFNVYESKCHHKLEETRLNMSRSRNESSAEVVSKKPTESQDENLGKESRCSKTKCQAKEELKFSTLMNL